ncbi:MAG: SPFH/Band 7/PHB domain protein [Clostridia bacterium]|nr:SPFH/Band 7/PHB domain protein [Clostridia bacterium]
MSPLGVILLVVVAILIIFAISSVRIVQQSYARVVERLGKFNRVINCGIHFIFPIVEKAGPLVSLKEIVADFPPQSVITKDNVTMQIDTVVYYQVTDPKAYTYGVERPVSAIENLTATTLRNIVGELELDETLTSRDTVNVKMREILDEATDPWGIKINRVELKNILPPKDIRDAMEKQMRAERERRESILMAEGEKQSAILVAEGEKQSKILRAEADKEAKILAAEATKASLEKEAEGLAEAIRLVNEANPTNGYLTIKGFEALEKVANGKATKLIVPSNIQDVTGLIASLTETTNFAKEPTTPASQPTVAPKTTTTSKSTTVQLKK